MTYEEIRTVLQHRAQRMLEATREIATHGDYRLGVMVGMVSGFKTAGMLTEDEADMLADELFDIVY